MTVKIIKILLLQRQSMYGACNQSAAQSEIIEIVGRVADLI